MHKFFGKTDCIIIGIVLGIIIIVLIVSYLFQANTGSYVKIEMDGKVYGIYSIEEDSNIEILDQDKKLINVLEIKDGYANMIEANCPDQLCVHQKKISKSNESIICLPHKIIVTIISDREGEIDYIVK